MDSFRIGGSRICGRKENARSFWGGGNKKKSEFLLKATLRNSIFTNTTVTETFDSLKYHKYLSAFSAVPKVFISVIVTNIFDF